MDKMASIIEGYTYDIFISYRQKDNKYDGWVTEFVDHLKRELEATFKDEVSVYFDINPHDGLLETHDVNASLKEKLKCLVFIPILSRTYCDSKSFAWEHEFKAFVDQASRDEFGLKITLSNGNVANRLLPVRIHDLDIADVKLYEMVIGGVLRGIDFIYKSAGVNRPLRSIEDNPHENLNHTFYRDQINKVALAIKDIIEGIEGSAAYVQVKDKIIQSEGQLQKKELFIDKPVKEEKSKSEKKIIADDSRPHLAKRLLLLKRSSLISVSVMFILIVILLIFSSGSTLPFSKRDWIVIADFENQTGNPVFDKSLYTAFSLSINQSSYINVFPKSRMYETLTRMKIEDKVFIDDKIGREIATREGFKIYIVPGITEVGKRYAITAKILETKTGNTLRSEILYADTQDKILVTLDQLCKKIRRNLGESRYNIATQDKPLAKVTTSSLEALKLYSLGIDHHLKMDFAGAKDYYEHALQVDSGFTAAKASLGSLMIEKFDQVKGGELLKQAVKSIDNLTEREKLGILAFYAVNVDKNLPKGIEYAKMRIELYPDDPVAHNNLGWYYQNSGRFEEAVKEYKAALRINPIMALTYGGILWIYLEKLGKADSGLVWSEKMIRDNPQNVWGYINLGAAWISLDSLKKAEIAYEKAREMNQNLTVNLFRLAHTYRLQGRYNEALAILKKIPEIDPNDASAFYDLGVNYQSMDNQKEAHIYLNRYKSIVSEVYMKKWPDDAGTYINMSAVMARLGELDSSKQMLQKAIKIDSTLHDRFAEVLCLQGNIPEALNQLEKAFNTGYRNLFWLKLSPDLQLLRYDTRYRDLMEKIFK
jgi:tetratricopeptide (TPR) repeat protein